MATHSVHNRFSFPLWSPESATVRPLVFQVRGEAGPLVCRPDPVGCRFVLHCPVFKIRAGYELRLPCEVFVVPQALLSRFPRLPISPSVCPTVLLCCGTQLCASTSERCRGPTPYRNKTRFSFSTPGWNEEPAELGHHHHKRPRHSGPNVARNFLGQQQQAHLPPTVPEKPDVLTLWSTQISSGLMRGLKVRRSICASQTRTSLIMAPLQSQFMLPVRTVLYT